MIFLSIFAKKSDGDWREEVIIGLEVGAFQRTSQTSAPLRLVDIHQAEEQGGVRSSETEEKTRKGQSSQVDGSFKESEHSLLSGHVRPERH